MNDGIKAVIDGGSDVWVRYENTPRQLECPRKLSIGLGLSSPIV